MRLGLPRAPAGDNIWQVAESGRVWEPWIFAMCRIDNDEMERQQMETSRARVADDAGVG